MAGMMSQLSPTIQDIERIAGLEDIVLRNLLITQAYHELSVSIRKHLNGANWCSYASWASKQAGQTIRKEDLKNLLESFLANQDLPDTAFLSVISIAKNSGIKSLEDFRQCGLSVLAETAAIRASDAVSRGNKKVFEEIAFHFSRFIADCANDTIFEKESISRFCESLRAGEPPSGQVWLRRAFTNYYKALFEKDSKAQAEICYLANLQIGFHEQTRLQPEIAEALNAAISNTENIKKSLLQLIFKNAGILFRIKRFFQKLFGTSLLDKAVEEFIVDIQHCLRTLLTAHLMTLTMPPGDRLKLGQDLSLSYCQELNEIKDKELNKLLAEIDSAPGTQKSGAADWADLKERINYIAELFRCYHGKKEIFDAVFLPEQVITLKQEKIPQGKL